MPPQHIPITLTADEALVLFDLLHRWEDSGHISQPRHDAERIVLWNLAAALERTLTEPFNPQYANLVHDARNRLAAS